MNWLLIFIFIFGLLAKSPVQAKTKKPEASNVPIALTTVSSLEEARLSLSPALPAEDQWDTYKKALNTFCESFKSQHAKVTKTEYLKELLLLAAKMYRIDSGKRPTDCFAPYYALNAEVINEIIETLPDESRSRLKIEINNAKSAFGRQ